MKKREYRKFFIFGLLIGLLIYQLQAEAEVKVNIAERVLDNQQNKYFREI
jgi:hypothetical protein